MKNNTLTTVLPLLAYMRPGHTQPQSVQTDVESAKDKIPHSAEEGEREENGLTVQEDQATINTTDGAPKFISTKFYREGEKLTLSCTARGGGTTIV